MLLILPHRYLLFVYKDCIASIKQKTRKIRTDLLRLRCLPVISQTAVRLAIPICFSVFATLVFAHFHQYTSPLLQENMASQLVFIIQFVMVLYVDVEIFGVRVIEPEVKLAFIIVEKQILCHQFFKGFHFLLGEVSPIPFLQLLTRCRWLSVSGDR
jgi:hypothetical protein